ncbi:hypothetical protein SDC9_150267 [bioreactor metagenome]|uniref:Uncharacterized protein n=1 Tax=bioreactor metagenome TaxID=1076179 RepID=A0A645ER17_9ZZZZ
MRNGSDGNHHVVILHQMSDLFGAGNVLRREDGDNPFRRPCRAGVNGKHFCARVATAHGGTKQHAGQMDVVCIHRGAKGLINHLDALDAVANRAWQLRLGNLGVFAEESGAQKNRIFNLLITRATADIVFDCFLDVRPRWIGVLID